MRKDAGAQERRERGLVVVHMPRLTIHLRDRKPKIKSHQDAVRVVSSLPTKIHTRSPENKLRCIAFREGNQVKIHIGDKIATELGLNNPVLVPVNSMAEGKKIFSAYERSRQR